MVKFSFIQKIGFGILIIILILQFTMISKLKHVPSPPYGGDLYRERGFVQYLINGNSYYSDPYFEGELEFYPPLGYVIPSILTKMGFDIELTPYYLSAIIMAATAVIFYFIGNNLFGKDYYGVLTALTYYLFSPRVDFKFSVALGAFFLALSIHYYLILMWNRTLRNKILLGVFIGLTALTHYKVFIHVVVIIGGLMIVDAVKRLIKNNNFKTVKEILNDYYIPILISLVISSIFFAPLLMKYSMKTLNETNMYSFTAPEGLKTLFEYFTGTFFYFANTRSILISIVLIVGLFSLINNIKNEKVEKISIIFFSILIASGHYLITKPLFNNWIVPNHIFSGSVYGKILILVLGIKTIEILFKKTIPLKFVIYGFIFLISVGIYSNYISYKDDQWMQYGMNFDDNSKVIYQISDWILRETDNSDVFVGNDESLFMINAISGRHLTTVRRTHASPYVNVEKRYADTMVMLYGENPDVVKNLIDEYNVKWLYYDYYLSTSPMVVKAEYADYLRDNGIEFEIRDVQFDPAAPDGLKYKSAVVFPQNVTLLDRAVDQASSHKQFFLGNGLYSSIIKVE